VCGLVGYINVGDRPANEKITRDMGNLIAHRGPDGDGYWTDKNISLGHRRLAIIDLSEVSNQPMFSADGRYIMVYNGEIYNYLDIRKDLESRGQKFKTQGDSEVLLKAFEIFGPDAFLKLNGMFACAIMDRKSGLLTLARDRFGVKPLYYMAQNGVFAFASEIKAFKGHPELSFKLNPHGLSEYLTSLLDLIFKLTSKPRPHKARNSRPLSFGILNLRAIILSMIRPLSQTKFIHGFKPLSVVSW